MLRQFKNNFLPLLLIFVAQKVCAQTEFPDDFFNSGAQLYISNNIPAALERTESGLKLFPNDEKLQKLEKLLKQQQQSQSQSQQNQQNQQQSQQNSKSQQNPQQDQQQQSQNSQEQKNSAQQKQDQADQQKKDEQQKQAQQQKSDAQKQNGEQKENQSGEEKAAGQMTPEEAKRLLDSQKGEEKLLQLKPQGKPENPNRPVKDW